jgi:hypothetical protein
MTSVSSTTFTPAAAATSITRSTTSSSNHVRAASSLPLTRTPSPSTHEHKPTVNTGEALELLNALRAHPGWMNSFSL